MRFVRSNSNICCDNVIKNVYELNSLDIEVYKKLRELKETRADFLAKEMKKERSTIYRSLQRLTLCKLCNKTTKKIEKGGYYHSYSCNESKKVREDIESCIDRWYDSMKNTLKEFEKEMG